MGDSGSGGTVYSSDFGRHILYGLTVQNSFRTSRGLRSVMLKIADFLEDFCYYLDLCATKSITGLNPILNFGTLYLSKKDRSNYEAFHPFRLISNKHRDQIKENCEELKEGSKLDDLCEMETNWAANIVLGDRVLCGATFITYEHLVTSRECIIRELKTINDSNLEIVYGEGRKKNVEFIAFSYTDPYGLAIVQLKEDNDFLSHDIQPVCLENPKETTPTNLIRGTNDVQTTFTIELQRASKMQYFRPDVTGNSERACTQKVKTCTSKENLDGSAVVSSPQLWLVGIQLPSAWAKHNNLTAHIIMLPYYASWCVYLNRCDEDTYILFNSILHFTSFYMC